MSSLGDSRVPSRAQLAVALLFFTVLTAVMNGAIVSDLDQHFAPASGDYAFGYWNVWWTAEALADFRNPLHTDRIFHPDGASLLWRDFPVLATAVAAPITWLFGPTVAYNLIYLLTFVLAGWGAYLLGRYVSGSHMAGLGAGAVYAFGPAHFLSFGQQSSSHMQWLPFMILALLKLRDDGRLAHGARAGMWLAFSLLCGLYYGIYSALAAVFLALAYSFFPRARMASTRQWLGGFALCFGVAAVLTSFRFVPMVLEVLQGTNIAHSSPGSRADLLGLTVRSNAGEIYTIVGWPSALGYVSLVGALIGSWKLGWRRSMVWWLLAFGFASIALGNTLRIAGREYPAIPMPADVLHRLPLLTSLRAYQRAILLVGLVLTMFYAVFLRWLEYGAARSEGPEAAGEGRRPGGKWLVLFGVLLPILEYWPPQATARPDPVPAFYRELAAEDDDRAIVVLPFDGEVVVGPMERPMFMQTVHGKPMVSGYYSRFNPEQRRRIQEHPFLGRLLAVEPKQDPTRPIAMPEASELPALRTSLSDWNIGTIVLQPQYLEGNAQPPTLAPFTVNAGYLLAPFWHGAVGKRLMREPRRDPYHLVVPEKHAWMDPSVREYLIAVLGEPTQVLEEDGALVWRLPQ